MRRSRWICASILVLFTSSEFQAQVRPGGAQPGQIEQQLARPPEPSSRPGAINLPATGQAAPANAEGIRFVLKDVILHGVTVYKLDALRKALAGFLGTEVNLAQVFRLAETLTARYRNDGYILSQVIVPAQSVEEGVVHLQAIEGYVSDVSVEGGSPSLNQRARAYANRIKSSKPLTAATLERQVLLLNDLPGVQARVVLAPGSAPGASALVLQLSQRRFDGGFTSDTRGSTAQGRQRIFTDADVNNLFGGASLTEVRDVTTFTPELTYVGVAHDQYVGSGGGKFTVEGSYVYSRPQELSFIPLNLVTNSVTLTLGYTQPLLRSRARNLYVRGSLSGFDSKSDIFEVKDTVDRIRAIRLGLTYDASDGLRGVNIVDLEYSHGLQGLGASKNGDEFLSRPNGKVDFQKARFYAARYQTLTSEWSIVGAASGQYAFDDLLAPELFAVGGEQFGRGYDASELLNDHGVAGRVDLRYTKVWPGKRSFGLMPYAFGDAGRVWSRTTFAGLDTTQTATSAGFGLRVSFGARTSAFAEFAKPLNRIVSQEKNDDPRIFVGFTFQ